MDEAVRTVRRLHDELQGLRRKSDLLEGRRTEAVAQLERLRTLVGKAKWRLSHKEKVTAFLSRMQEDMHRSMVGEFNRILTQVVQEVIPHAGGIVLKPYTERGQPALDILSERTMGDLLDTTGLSVTNVVSLGLRSMAVVKSGLRRFLALDEPDVWVKGTRIKAFYDIARQMAEDIAFPGGTKPGFQMLIVSHHDESNFVGPFSIIRLIGKKGSPTTVALAQTGPAWRDDAQEGIRGMRLRNYRMFEDVHIPLCPGVNLLSGDNDSGKSGGMQGMRSLAYGGKDASDGDIRKGADACQVDLFIERGRTVSWTRRRPGRSPVMSWRMTEADGSIGEIDGTKCDGSGADGKPPAWVAKVLRLGRMDDIDLNLGRQRDTIFLLDRTPAQRAKVLSVGRESDRLREMIALHKERCDDDSKTVRNGEKDAAAAMARLDGLAGLPAVLAEIDAHSGVITELEESAGRLAAMRASADNLAALRARTAAAEALTGILAPLAPPPDGGAELALARSAAAAAESLFLLKDRLARAEAVRDALASLPRAEPPAPDWQPMLSAATRLTALTRAAKQASALSDVLASLPEPPARPDVGALSAASARLVQAQAMLDKEALATARIGAEMAAVGIRVAEALDAVGNICPLCGSHGVEGASILGEAA